MTARTQILIKVLAQSCLDRIDQCGDYPAKPGKGRPDSKKTAEMCLNYFCGAASLARVQGDDEMVNHLTLCIAFGIALSGVREVEKMALWKLEPETAAA